MDAIDLDTRIAEARARLSQRELDAKAAAAAQWTEQMNAAMNAAAAQYHPHLDGDLDEALRAAWAFRWHVERDTRSDRGGVPVVRGFDLTLDGEAVHVALSKDWTAYYWSVSPSGESTKRVEVGTLADTLLVWLAQAREKAATREAKATEEARRAEERRAEREREEAEREAEWQAVAAEWTARVAAAQAEDEAARRVRDAYMARYRFTWPRDMTLTLFQARWYGTALLDEDGDPVGGTYEAWSFWDQPDSDGYFTFFQPRERLKPPANAVTWRKVEARSVADLPDALRRGGTGIYVPGLARVGLQVPWEARRRSDLDSSYAFLARREGSVIIEGVSEQRPVDWVCEALGVALPPAIQATTTDQTVYDDECPF